MTSPFVEEMEHLRAQYRKARNEFVETSQKIRSLTGTATSPDGFVTIAVGSQGELTELKFNNEKYRDMTQKDLAKVIQDTFKNAREGLAGQMRKILPSSPFPQASAEEMSKPDFDWGTLIPDDIPDVPSLNSRSRRGPVNSKSDS